MSVGEFCEVGKVWREESDKVRMRLPLQCDHGSSLREAGRRGERMKAPVSGDDSRSIAYQVRSQKFCQHCCCLQLHVISLPFTVASSSH